MKILVSAMALAIALAWPNGRRGAKQESEGAQRNDHAAAIRARHAKVEAHGDREAVRCPHLGTVARAGIPIRMCA